MLGLLAALAGVVIVFVAIGFALPPTRTVSRSITINASVAAVYPLVSSFKDGWAAWNPITESTEPPTFGGPNEGVGARQAWKGKAGVGSMTITQADPHAGIRYDVTIGTGLKANGRIELQPADSWTRVSWVDDVELGSNPALRWIGVLMDSKRLRNLERGLERLKAEAERGGAK